MNAVTSIGNESFTLMIQYLFFFSPQLNSTCPVSEHSNQLRECSVTSLLYHCAASVSHRGNFLFAPSAAERKTSQRCHFKFFLGGGAGCGEQISLWVMIQNQRKGKDISREGYPPSFICHLKFSSELPLAVGAYRPPWLTLYGASCEWWHHNAAHRQTGEGRQFGHEASWMWERLVEHGKSFQNTKAGNLTNVED